MEEGYTTIQISRKLWKEMLSMRTEPKETFNDVIERLLDNFHNQNKEKK